MDAEDRKLFASALRDITAKTAGGCLDGALAELGWAEALVEDPRTATSLLFEQQGLVNARSSALQLLVAGDAAVLLPRLGGHTAPGAMTAAGLEIDGLATQPALGAAEVLVIARTAPHQHALFRVSSANLMQKPAEGMDPALGLTQVLSTEFDVPASQPFDWETAVIDAQRALAHELVGVSRAMLQLARDHAVTRIQGGRSIASFQAVRHRLSDCVVAIEAADATVTAAWEAPSSISSALAKAVSGRAARTVAKHAQQVLAGMGFTREHPLHHHVRRALLLDALFGSVHSLAAEIGTEALRTRRVPALVPL